MLPSHVRIKSKKRRLSLSNPLKIEPSFYGSLRRGGSSRKVVDTRMGARDAWLRCGAPTGQREQADP